MQIYNNVIYSQNLRRRNISSYQYYTINQHCIDLH